MNAQKQYPERYEGKLSNLVKYPLGSARLYSFKMCYTIRQNISFSKNGILRILRGLKWLILRRRLPPISVDSKFVLTVGMSKNEYDLMGEREHVLYDANSTFKVDCCGVLVPMGFRDYRNYISMAIAARVPEPYGLFLDFGSGNGFNAKALSVEFPNANIIGIDISRSRIEYAKKWIGQSDNIDFLQMNAACLAFPENYFDFVYSCHALEQMESIIDKAVSEIIRVMKYRAVLIEPVQENASLPQRLYLRRYNYVQSLLRTIKEQRQYIKIVEIFPLGIQGNPLNQSSLIVLEKIV